MHFTSIADISVKMSNNFRKLGPKIDTKINSTKTICFVINIMKWYKLWQ